MGRAPVRDQQGLRTWMLPALAAAIVVPLSLGFLLGGPLVGMLAGLIAVIAVVVVAIRKPPGGG